MKFEAAGDGFRGDLLRRWRIPVIREDRAFHGVDAVIDKDLTSAILAEEVGVDTLLIASDVEGVALHYGQPHQHYLRTLTLKEADRFQRDGQFPPGSMGPKWIPIRASRE